RVVNVEALKSRSSRPKKVDQIGLRFHRDRTKRVVDFRNSFFPGDADVIELREIGLLFHLHENRNADLVRLQSLQERRSELSLDFRRNSVAGSDSARGKRRDGD